MTGMWYLNSIPISSVHVNQLCTRDLLQAAHKQIVLILYCLMRSYHLQKGQETISYLGHKMLSHPYISSQHLTN